jgi:DNA-directed RNA polymerase specialized sigma24 family protein
MRPRPAHFDRLLRILGRKSRSREDAEDLIQEAMLRLHVHCQEAPVANAYHLRIINRGDKLILTDKPAE